MRPYFCLITTCPILSIAACSTSSDTNELASASATGSASSSSSAMAASSGAGGGNCTGGDGGSGAMGTAVALAASLNPQGIALGCTEVFWAEYGTPGQADGAVKRVAKAGGAASIVVKSPKPQHLVLTPSGVVFTDETGGIHTAPLDGGAATTIASTDGPPGRIATDGRDVFFVDTGALKSVPVAGGTVRTITTQLAFSFALDGATLYLADFSGGSLASVATSGGAVQTLATGQMGPLYPATDGAALFWMNAGIMADPNAAGVMKLDLASASSPAPLALGAELYHTHGFVLDGETFYMLTEGSATTLGGLLRLPKSGGVPVALMSSKLGNALAVDDRYVYWSTIIADGLNGSGGIMKLAK